MSLTSFLFLIHIIWRICIFHASIMICNYANRHQMIMHNKKICNFLYFACPFTFALWLKVAGGLLGHSVTPDWDDTITILLVSNQVRLGGILLKLLFQGVVTRSGKREILEDMVEQALRWMLLLAQYTRNHKLERLLRKMVCSQRLLTQLYFPIIFQISYLPSLQIVRQTTVLPCKCSPYILINKVDIPSKKKNAISQN